MYMNLVIGRFRIYHLYKWHGPFPDFLITLETKETKNIQELFAVIYKERIRDCIVRLYRENKQNKKNNIASIYILIKQYYKMDFHARMGLSAYWHALISVSSQNYKLKCK